MLSSTRVIYSGDKQKAPLLVKSTSKTDEVIQLWVSDFNEDSNESLEEKKPEIVVFPNVIKVRDGKPQYVYISLLSDSNGNSQLPQDKESIFWITARKIPLISEETEGKPAISIAQAIKIKLLYRPEGLEDNTKRNNAEEKLSMTCHENKILVENVTPYIFSPSKYRIKNQDVPYFEVIYPGKNKTSLPCSENVDFHFFDDYGTERKYSYKVN